MRRSIADAANTPCAMNFATIVREVREIGEGRFFLLPMFHKVRTEAGSRKSVFFFTVQCKVFPIDTK